MSPEEKRIDREAYQIVLGWLAECDGEPTAESFTRLKNRIRHALWRKEKQADHLAGLLVAGGVTP